MLRRLIDSPSTYYVGAAILLLVAISTQFELRTPSRQKGSVADLTQLRSRGDLNVVFILIDTLRADRMGVYGYSRPTTPMIDDLARSGIVFDRVIAQSSWTKSSMASLWTGTYPAANGVLRFNHVVPEEAVMPAEIFKEAGQFRASLGKLREILSDSIVREFARFLESKDRSARIARPNQSDTEAVVGFRGFG